MSINKFGTTREVSAFGQIKDDIETIMDDLSTTRSHQITFERELKVIHTKLTYLTAYLKERLKNPIDEKYSKQSSPILEKLGLAKKVEDAVHPHLTPETLVLSRRKHRQS